MTSLTSLFFNRKIKHIISVLQVYVFFVICDFNYIILYYIILYYIILYYIILYYIKLYISFYFIFKTPQNKINKQNKQQQLIATDEGRCTVKIQFHTVLCFIYTCSVLCQLWRGVCLSDYYRCLILDCYFSSWGFKNII